MKYKSQNLKKKKKQYSFDISFVCRNTFYFMGTSLFWEKKKTQSQKTDLTIFPQFLPVKYSFGIFNSIFSNFISILEHENRPHKIGG